MNGAGKTTQLQIITGQLQPDGGEVIKARANMKIAHLTQEFDVVPTRTVRWADGGVPAAVQQAACEVQSNHVQAAVLICAIQTVLHAQPQRQASSALAVHAGRSSCRRSGSRWSC